jgi:hypothetical protein
VHGVTMKSSIASAAEGFFYFQEQLRHFDADVPIPALARLGRSFLKSTDYRPRVSTKPRDWSARGASASRLVFIHPSKEFCDEEYQ